MKTIFFKLVGKYHQFAILKLSIDPQNTELVNLYKGHVEKHNQSILNDPFPNAGFDLFVPETTTVQSTNSTMISMNVKCEMLDHYRKPSGFYMFARSSISKTPLMLANHTGVIDSGYRGFLIGAFRGLNLLKTYEVEKNTRLLQICHPSLCPIFVMMVDNIGDLSTTERGSGGFGSTGR
jgi:dUTP pyrophosphatase